MIKVCDSGYRTAIDGAGSWSFGNDFARTVVIFGVNKYLPSHTDNCENIFLVLGDGPTGDINGSVGTTEKRFSSNFGKVKTKFLH